MSLMTINRDALGHRLSVIGTPRHLNPQLVDIWHQWVTHNGPEWAVKRFKSLKVDLIRRQAGLPYLTTYVRKNRHGEYYGAIGALFRWAATSEKKFSLALQALCIYTSETSPSATDSQIKKFIGGVSNSEPTGMSFNELTELMNVTSALIGPRNVFACDNRMIVYRGSPAKIAPLPHDLGYTPQDRNILTDLTWFRYPGNSRFYLRHKTCFDRVLKGIGPISRPFPIDRVDRTSYAGEVHFIQEPGYKLRSVASPYRILQLALQPLKDELGRIVSTLPWDCTFDQSKAMLPIQECLRKSKMVYSIDLSSATDYFPLDIQVCVLRSIFGDSPDVRLFHDVSRLTWKSELGDITWKRGQPLGLNPSFFAFTLTHGLVLAWLSEMRPEQFYVIGDDVVILDTELYERYIKWLERVHCPYSVDKSLESPKLAEFAGKVITPTGIYPQLKWRKMSDDSFLDLARLLGRRSRQLMTRRQRRVFDAVMHLLPPVGLNMSKPGSDLLSSFMETERVLDQVQHKAVRSLTDLIRPATANAMDDPQEHILDVSTDTFDEKVQMVFQKTIFSHWLWLDHVSDLPQALGLEPRLPLMASPGRVSTLSRYERILDRVAK